MRETETRRWTVEEYHRMAQMGILDPDERVELIDGEILRVTHQGARHNTAIKLGTKALAEAFGPTCHVQIQGPLVLGPASEPEPDLAVLQGLPRDYRDSLPTSSLLICEISDTTLQSDRERKGSLYARAGILEYWIVNLLERVVEVYRNPIPSSSARYGWEYQSVERYSAGQSISPLHAPHASVAVDDLLP